jgi:hypothetical protein
VKLGTLALLGITGVAFGAAIAEVAPKPRAPGTAAAAGTAAATATAAAAPTAAAAAAAPATARRVTPALRATRPVETFDRVDENGEPIIQHGRFAGWTQSQWREYYGGRLDQMWRELNDAEAVLTRGCANADDQAACLAAVANARVQVRDLRLRIDFDERDLASVVDAR